MRESTRVNRQAQKQRPAPGALRALLTAAAGVDLPAVGDLVTLTTAPDAGTFPPVATSVTPLQPTVEGVLTRVQPTAVELNVRTVTPEGRASDVPVPVNEPLSLVDVSMLPLASMRATARFTVADEEPGGFAVPDATA